MGEATRASLLALGFPLAHRATLHLKPTASINDTVFKADAVGQIRALGEVIATFENEPANANLFARSFPSAIHILLATAHSPNAPALSPRVRIWKDFQE